MSKSHIIKISIALLLIAALFLQGCQFLNDPDTSVPDPPQQPEPEASPPRPPQAADPHAPGQFTLRYDPNSSLNPLTSLSRDNILVASLMYESLFTLDSDLNASPLLCDNWSSEDNITFQFVLKTNIAMSDGSWLTADDVVYTIRQAMQRGRFVNRFTSVASIASDGDLTVTIVLHTPNSQFIKLLDVPIIKNGTIDRRNPPGTGPYVFSDPDNMFLTRYLRYRDFMELPISVVYLIQCDDDELTQLFDDGKISLLWDDPSDAFEIRLNRLYDPRFYNTTALQFIGFNGRSGIMRDPYVRRAVGCAVDRDYIVNNIMPPGHAVAARLPLPPYYWLYDSRWELSPYDPYEEMSLLLQNAYLEDYNDDSFLETSDGLGGYHEFSVVFIVNSENMYRVQAAQRIADALTQVGFDITVRELPWDSYISALEAGNFDMYYGEVMLGADFNLSPLLLPGGVNYGGTASATYRPFIEDFLMVRTQSEANYAVSRLFEEIIRNSPFVPVLYKRYVVYSPMGAITGSSPGQSNIFRNITDWTINLTMLT